MAEGDSGLGGTYTVTPQKSAYDRIDAIIQELEQLKRDIANEVKITWINVGEKQ